MDDQKYRIVIDDAYKDILSNWKFTRNGIEQVEDKPKKTIMKRLSNAVKKFLNADLQAQLKAGYRNGDLELTQEGKDVLLELLADTVGDRFTTAANEKIAEEEKKLA